MSDLISRADAMEEFRECVKRANENGETPTWNDAVSLIGSLPSAEAEWKMTEEVREALMRLTMCAREECDMCKYKDKCGFEFQYNISTENMNTILDALSADTVSREEYEELYRKAKEVNEMANDILADFPSYKELVSTDAVQGEWEHWGSPFSDESEVIDTIVCSVCGARFIEPKDEPKGEYNYCPNCGADMMAKEREESEVEK